MLTIDLKLKDIGEREAIEIIANILDTEHLFKDTIGIGDDCAALDLGERYLLVTTDVIAEKTHIPRGASPKDIGWHIIAINLSDIAAMGGKPLGIVVALGLPKFLSVNFLKELAEGMNDCASEFGISVIGGDTKEHEQLTLCGTAFGVVGKDEIMRREGAKVGDVIAVTGKLGRGGSAYYALKRKTKFKKTIRSLLRVFPKVIEAQVLAKMTSVSCCMDISDGLAASIYQLGKRNDVGFEIDLEKIPIAKEVKDISTNEDELKEMVLYHGGDYELLLTIKRERIKEAIEAVKNVGTSLTPIGLVTKKKENVLITSKGIEALENKGYEHFRGEV